MIITNLYRGETWPNRSSSEHCEKILEHVLDTTDVFHTRIKITNRNADTNNPIAFYILYNSEEHQYDIRAVNGALGHTFVSFSAAVPNRILASMMIAVIEKFSFD